MAVIKAVSSKAGIGQALDYVTKEEKTEDTIKLTPQKWGVIFNYIFPKTLLIRLAVKRSKGSILYNISK